MPDETKTPSVPAVVDPGSAPPLAPPPLPPVVGTTPAPAPEALAAAAAVPPAEQYISPEVRAALEQMALGKISLGEVFGRAGLAATNPKMLAQETQNQRLEQGHAQSVLAQLQSYADSLQKAQIMQQTQLLDAQQQASDMDFKAAANRYETFLENSAGADLSGIPQPTKPFSRETVKEWDDYHIRALPKMKEAQRVKAKASAWAEVFKQSRLEAAQGLIFDKKDAVEIARARLRGMGAFDEATDEANLESAVSGQLERMFKHGEAMRQADLDRSRALTQQTRSQILKNDAEIDKLRGAIRDGDPDEVMRTAVAVAGRSQSLNRDVVSMRSEEANIRNQILANPNDVGLRKDYDFLTQKRMHAEAEAQRFADATASLLPDLEAARSRLSIRERAPLIISDVLVATISDIPGETLAGVLQEVVGGAPYSPTRATFLKKLIERTRADFGDSITPFQVIKSLEEAVFAQAQAASVAPAGAQAEGVFPPAEENVLATQYAQTPVPPGKSVTSPGYVQPRPFFTDEIKKTLGFADPVTVPDVTTTMPGGR